MKGEYIFSYTTNFKNDCVYKKKTPVGKRGSGCGGNSEEAASYAINPTTGQNVYNCLKYRLTEETRNLNTKTLYRIEALCTFGDVHKGDKGGFIEKEENLSQNGLCWVYDEACVYGNAKVIEDAKVKGESVIHSNATIRGEATVSNHCIIKGWATIGGNVYMEGKMIVGGCTKFFNNMVMRGELKVIGYKNKRKYLL